MSGSRCSGDDRSNTIDGLPSWNTGVAGQKVVSTFVVQSNSSGSYLSAVWEGTTGPTPYQGFQPGMPAFSSSLDRR